MSIANYAPYTLAGTGRIHTLRDLPAWQLDSYDVYVDDAETPLVFGTGYTVEWVSNTPDATSQAQIVRITLTTAPTSNVYVEYRGGLPFDTPFSQIGWDARKASKETEQVAQTALVALDHANKAQTHSEGHLDPNAVGTLQYQILQEALARTQADATEVTARTNADDTERQERIAADTAEENARTAADTAIRDALPSDATETTAGLARRATLSEVITGQRDGYITPSYILQATGRPGAYQDALIAVANAAADTRIHDRANEATASVPGVIRKETFTAAAPGVGDQALSSSVLLQVLTHTRDNAMKSAVANIAISATSGHTADGGFITGQQLQDAFLNTDNAATTQRLGLTQYATDAEITTGTAQNRSITPAGLKARLDAFTPSTTDVPDATTTARGIIEIATREEVIAQNSAILAVTPATLAAWEAEQGDRGGGGTTYTLPAATSSVLGGVRLADISSFNAGALPVADRPRVVTLEDFREVFGVSNTGGAVAQPSLVRATTTKEGLVRIASAIATDSATNNVAVPTVSQVRTALAGKEDTLADAVRVATGGTSGQLLSRAASGGTSWIDAPSGGGGGGTLGGEYEAIVTTRVNQNGNWQNITLPAGRSLTDYAAFEAAFDGTVVDGPVVGNISYDTVLAAGAHGAEIAFGLGANGFGSLRIQGGVLQWSIRNNAGHIAASSDFGLISLRGLRLAEIPADSGGGTGATTFAALTDTPTAASLRANPSEVLVTNVVGDAIVTQSLQAVVRDGVQTAGVGQTAVDNRVKSASNAMTTSTYGVGQLASGGDARALQPSDTGLINVDSLRQVINDLPSGTRLPTNLTELSSRITHIHDAGDTLYRASQTRVVQVAITNEGTGAGTVSGDQHTAAHTQPLAYSNGVITGWGELWAQTTTSVRIGRTLSRNQTLVGFLEGSNETAWMFINAAGQLTISADGTSQTIVNTGAGSLSVPADGDVINVKAYPAALGTDSIGFYISRVRGTTGVEAQTIEFTSGRAAFIANFRRNIFFRPTSGSYEVDRIVLSLDTGFRPDNDLVLTAVAANRTAEFFGLRYDGPGRTTFAETGDKDILGTLKAYNDKNELQNVVLDDDARLSGDGGGGGGGVNEARVEELIQSGSVIRLPSGTSATVVRALPDGTTVLFEGDSFVSFSDSNAFFAFGQLSKASFAPGVVRDYTINSPTLGTLLVQMRGGTILRKVSGSSFEILGSIAGYGVSAGGGGGGGAPTPVDISSGISGLTLTLPENWATSGKTWVYFRARISNGQTSTKMLLIEDINGVSSITNLRIWGNSAGGVWNRANRTITAGGNFTAFDAAYLI